MTFAVLALISPFILTRSFSRIDFTNTGQIGDTIGGLTAPILNFLTIILLYLALKEQIDANKIQKDIERTSRDYDIIFDQLANLKKAFDDIQLSVKSGTTEITYNGTRAIFEYSNILQTSTNITISINEYSIRAFSLSYAFVSSNLFFILKKNFTSSLSQEDKESIYATLVQLRTPLNMVAQATGIYAGKKKGTALTEIEKAVTMHFLMTAFYKSEFDKYNPTPKKEEPNATNR